ncbi:MAG: 2-amino-4-hydroxy-6-hydroxymethyldihydropteridine diphosphokinase [bacterium]|nr:MAG: 2-amino-4-hydroxy-6-hydroxymethyldihydropteridine diphosphokinase [bacterium]
MGFDTHRAINHDRNNAANHRNIKVYLSLGSNMGDGCRNLETALRALGLAEDIQLEAVSDFYRTEPVGIESNPVFTNCAVEITTPLAPLELLDRLEDMELYFGRNSKNLKSPRTLDMDILLYGDLIVSLTRLVIPHREMARRRFVLEPLAQIAPNVIHPVLKKTPPQLSKELEGQKVFRILSEKIGNA